MENYKLPELIFMIFCSSIVVVKSLFERKRLRKPCWFDAPSLTSDSEFKFNFFEHFLQEHDMENYKLPELIFMIFCSSIVVVKSLFERKRLRKPCWFDAPSLTSDSEFKFNFFEHFLQEHDMENYKLPELIFTIF